MVESTWHFEEPQEKQTRAAMLRRSNRGRALAAPVQRRARIPQEMLETILELRATRSAIRVSFAIMEEVVKRAQGQCSEGKGLSFPLCSLVVWGLPEFGK